MGIDINFGYLTLNQERTEEIDSDDESAPILREAIDILECRSSHIFHFFGIGNEMFEKKYPMPELPFSPGLPAPTVLSSFTVPHLMEEKQFFEERYHEPLEYQHIGLDCLLAYNWESPLRDAHWVTRADYDAEGARLKCLEPPGAGPRFTDRDVERKQGESDVLLTEEEYFVAREDGSVDPAARYLIRVPYTFTVLEVFPHVGRALQLLRKLRDPGRILLYWYFD